MAEEHKRIDLEYELEGEERKNRSVIQMLMLRDFVVFFRVILLTTQRRTITLDTLESKLGSHLNQNLAKSCTQELVCKV